MNWDTKMNIKDTMAGAVFIALFVAGWVYGPWAMAIFIGALIVILLCNVLGKCIREILA